MKLGLIVGHEKKAQGAVMAPPHSITEYAYNRDIALLAKQFSLIEKFRHIEVEIFYRDGIGIFGAFKKVKAANCDCVIELHFNAANKKAIGTETLCSNEATDKQFAYIVQQRVEKVFDRIDGGAGDRGVKVLSNGDRGSGSVVSYPGKANCLVEPFFGDTPSEANMAVNRKTQYAKALLEAANEWGQLYGG